jgi:hypothetical protein
LDTGSSYRLGCSNTGFLIGSNAIVSEGVKLQCLSIDDDDEGRSAKTLVDFRSECLAPRRDGYPHLVLPFSFS